MAINVNIFLSESEKLSLRYFLSLIFIIIEGQQFSIQTFLSMQFMDDILSIRRLGISLNYSITLSAIDSYFSYYNIILIHSYYIY